MLPKKSRLPAYLIQQLFETGRKCQSVNITVYAQLSAVNTRCSVVAGKFVSKKAVIRNRNKRLVREAVRVVMGETKSNFDAVILIRKDISGLNIGYLADEIRKIFIKCGFI